MANKTPRTCTFLHFLFFPYRGFFVCSCLFARINFGFSFPIPWVFYFFSCTILFSLMSLGFFVCAVAKSFCDEARGGYSLRSEDEPLRGRG